MKEFSTTMTAAVRRTVAASTTRIVMPLLAVVLLGGTGLALSTTSASAAPATVAARDVFAPRGITPDVNTVLVEYEDGDTFPHNCNGGAVYPINAKVVAVGNGCTVRVWLHETTTPGSKSECFDAKHSYLLSTPYIDWATLQITNNQNPCPLPGS